MAISLRIMVIAFHLQPVAQKQAHHSNGVFCGEFVSNRKIFYLELHGIAIKYGGTYWSGILSSFYLGKIKLTSCAYRLMKGQIQLVYKLLPASLASL